MKIQEFVDMYEKLAKKYSLPTIDDLDRQISIKKVIQKYKKIKKEESLLKIVVNRYITFYRKFRTILEDVLNPDLGDLATMHEIKGLQFDYNKIWKLYKRIVRIFRMKKLLDIEYSDDLAVKLINDMYDIFDDVKKICKEILEKKIEFWNRDIKYKGFKEYIG